MNTFRGLSFRGLYEATPVEQSRLVNNVDSSVYGARTIRPSRNQ